MLRRHRDASRAMTATRRFRLRGLPLLAVALFFAGACGDASVQTAGEARPEAAARNPRQNDDAWVRMTESEDLVYTLDPARAAIARSLGNLRLPDLAAAKWFADEVGVVDVSSGEAQKLGDAGVTRTRFDPADYQAIARSDLHLWRPLLQQLDRVEHASFGVLSASFVGSIGTTFQTTWVLEAAAYSSENEPLRLHAVVDLQWSQRPEKTGASAWTITRWKTKELTLLRTPSVWFREELAQRVADPALARALKRSRHQELVSAYLDDPDGFELPHRWFKLMAHDRHPAVAVADVDGDGHDDIYLMPMWGPNALLRARGDGTFEEVASLFGLDIEDHTTAGLFVDFDNDGDLDAVLGRSLAPSLYLRNEDGHFVDRSKELVGDALPSLVSSLAAADVNGDGLSDLYVSTYAGDMIVKGLERGVYRRGEPMLSGHVSDAVAQRLGELVSADSYHEYRALPGPPNVLLMNQGGGRFAAAAAGTVPEVFANTYQATFSDYDGDGDADLYVANDFGLNNLFRNDEGRLTDVTVATGTQDVGFGMGASWGDYDRDGRPDLYVSNMYSKAGNRVTTGLPGLHPAFEKMAHGNTLFHNDGAGFSKVSGKTPDTLEVEVAGWSWGGQFVDVDNDAFLDVYALSGYYSAPPDHAIPVDV